MGLSAFVLRQQRPAHTKLDVRRWLNLAGPMIIAADKKGPSAELVSVPAHYHNRICSKSKPHFVPRNFVVSWSMLYCFGPWDFCQWASCDPHALVMLGQDRVRVVVSDFEEDLDKSTFKDPRDYAVANAEGKAREVKHAQLYCRSSPLLPSCLTVTLAFRRAQE